MNKVMQKHWNEIKERLGLTKKDVVPTADRLLEAATQINSSPPSDESKIEESEEIVSQLERLQKRRETRESPFGKLTLIKPNGEKSYRKEDVILEVLTDVKLGRNIYDHLLADFKENTIRELNLKSPLEFLVLDLAFLNFFRAYVLELYVTGWSSNKKVTFRDIDLYDKASVRRQQQFLKSLEALRTLRSTNISIQVQPGSQLNIGDKQLNLQVKTKPKNFLKKAFLIFLRKPTKN